MKKRPIIWIVVFMLLTACPSITWFFSDEFINGLDYGQRNASYTYFYKGNYVDTAADTTEDTPAKPVLSLHNYKNFPELYENYYNASIPYRKLLIKLNSQLNYHLFHQSVNEDVIPGKENWLFYKDSVASSLGKWTFTQEKLKQIAENLTHNRDLLKGQGIEMVLFIPPNKATVYPEYLPGYCITYSDHSPAEQLVSYLKEHTDIKVVFPAEELKSAKTKYKDMVLYHELDTHWNIAGAYIGADCLANALGKDLPDIEKASCKEYKFSDSDLTNMIGMPIKDGDTDYDISGYGEENTNLINWDYHTSIIYQTEGKKGNLFVLRDSFASALSQHLSTLYHNSYFINRTKYDQKQIFDYKSDVVVLEYTERNLRQLEDFKMSYISCQLEKWGNENKRLVINPVVPDTTGEYEIKLYKKETGAKDAVLIKKRKMQEGKITYTLPESEKGTFTVQVMDSKGSQKEITEIEY